MIIKKIGLKNFHKFNDIEFKFNERFTALAGENAVGKTAILDGVAVAIGGFLAGIKDVDSRNIRADEVRLSQFNNGGIINIEPQYPTEVQCDAHLEKIELSWKRSLNSLKGKTTRKDASEIISYAEMLVTDIRAGENIILPVFAYHGTGRLWAQINESDDTRLETGSRLLGYKNCLNPISNEKLFLKWFKKMTLIDIQENKKLPQLKSVKQAIQECLKGIYIGEKICNPKVEYSINSDQLEITLENGQKLPFHYLSDGYRNVIGMIADIAFRMSVLNPSLEDKVIVETPGIVLIDEIDLHLHPKWQRRIVDDLKRVFPKIQFVVTTHSPFIIQSLDIGELQILGDNKFNEGFPKYEDMSVEDVTEKLMDVDMPQWSEKKQRMYEAAEEYFKVLRHFKDENNDKVKDLKERLDTLSKPFESNVAFVAYLEQKRAIAESKLSKENK